MTIVVDLGCAEVGTETSVVRLAQEFKPSLLFGFDPQIRGGITWALGGTTIIRAPLAAWIFDGHVHIDRDGTRTRIVPSSSRHADRVPCFDLNSWLRALPPAKIIVKMDVEGAEYELLPRLVFAPRKPDLLLVEWHDDPINVDHLDIPIEEWT